ncbi:MAG: S41 family peptidase [Flavobacteriales bacterium]|nr:S41 family peptidase [Flavobacteriales bacterium]
MLRFVLTCAFYTACFLTFGQGDIWHENALLSEAFAADMKVLEEFLIQNHGGFDQYTSAQTKQSLLDGMQSEKEVVSLAEAYRKMAIYIDKIHDGHTWVMPSEMQSEYLLATQKFMPFTVKVTGRGMFVEQNFSDCYDLEEGTELVAINGLPIRKVVNELMPYFTADGYSLNGKLGGMEGQFWWYYALHFGFHESHIVEYKGKTGAERALVPSIYMNDLINDASEIYCRYSFDNDAPMTFEIDQNIGVITVSSFNGWSLRKYKVTLLNALNEMEVQGCEELIIDVRGNGGGREGVENLLLSCIENSMEAKYDKVVIRSPQADDYEYIDHAFAKRMEDLVYRLIEFRKDEEGEWQRRDRFSRTFVEPENRFEGQVTVLIDRNVFSGAAEFAALAKTYGTNCTLIGEETCGGYQGHTSGYYYDLVLPNTGFIVHVPRIWFDLNVEGTHNGGVLPDVQLYQNPFTDSKDVVMEFARTRKKEWLSKE